MMEGFIKNNEILKEDNKIEDLLNLKFFEKNLSNKLFKIKRSSTLGLIGKYGSGKSTLLFQIQSKDKDNKWIEFDAWKYPDRQDLWEGFILDFAEQIGQDRKKLSKSIDRGTTNSTKVDIFTDIVGLLEDTPILNIIDKVFKEVFDKSPAKRTYQLQEILKSLIKSINTNIFIIIEDIDRSGDAGIYFLETLKYFINIQDIDKKIIVIVPISEDSYYKYSESYFKCLDYIEFFSPNIFNLLDFVEKVFIDGDKVIIPPSRDPVDLNKMQIQSFLETLISTYPNISMRVLKSIIRKANLNYLNQSEDGYDPDWRMSLCFEAMKYVPYSSGNNNKMFDEVKKRKVIYMNNPFSALMEVVRLHKLTIYDDSSDQKKIITPFVDIKLVNKPINSDIKDFPSIPYAVSSFRDDGLYVCSFYLDY